MAELIKNRALVTDPYARVADDAPLPVAGTPVLVTLKRWQAERDALLARGGDIGVQVPGTTPAGELAADLVHFALVAIEFPSFKDGRGYTLARLLRERHGYRGELRAVGDVLRDQLFFLSRAGFDAFALRADQDIDEALTAFDDFTVRYQPAADEPLPLYRRRG